jgi:hypothetical protein
MEFYLPKIKQLKNFKGPLVKRNLFENEPV